MADDALARVYPDKRATLDFAEGRFSPGADYLALVLKNIRTGDPEQVWLYDLRSRRLIPVTDPNDSLEIRNVTWSKDGVLYVHAWRGRFVSTPLVFMATMNGTREIPGPPPNGLFDEASSILHVGGACCERQDPDYAVRVTLVVHGIHTLSVKPAGARDWTELVSGGFELETALFDRTRAEVLYPTLGGIASISLRTRQTRSVISLNNPLFPSLLDQTPGGRFLAYVEYGACQWPAQPASELRVDPPRHVCIAEWAQ